MEYDPKKSGSVADFVYGRGLTPQGDKKKIGPEDVQQEKRPS